MSQFQSTTKDMSAEHAGTKKWRQKHSDHNEVRLSLLSEKLEILLALFGVFCVFKIDY